MPRLLVLQLKRIGDAVLTAPAVGALRAAWPEARITLMLAGAAGELGPLFSGADEVLVWETGGLNLALLQHVGELSPSLVLDFTGTDRSALLSLLSGAPVRAGYGKSAGGLLRRTACTLTCEAPVRELHTIDFHQALGAAAGRPEAAVPDAGHLILPSGLKRPDVPDSYVLVHPGTAREEKFWPANSWASLLDDLHSRHGVPIVMTGGKGKFERQHLAGILAATTAPVLDLSGTLSLPQLTLLTAGARLAVTVDTAAMHLASSFMVPQIALFGPTNPFHWAPRHQRATVLQSGMPEGTPWRPRQPGAPMAGLTWERVAAAARQYLE